MALLDPSKTGGVGCDRKPEVRSGEHPSIFGCHTSRASQIQELQSRTKISWRWLSNDSGFSPKNHQTDELGVSEIPKTTRILRVMVEVKEVLDVRNELD